MENKIKKKKQNKEVLKIGGTVKGDKKEKIGKEKAKKFPVWIPVVIVAVAIIVFISVMFWKDVFPKNDEQDMYNGYLFMKNPTYQLWNVTIKSQGVEKTIEFYYHPRELENISYDRNITQRFSETKLKRGKFFIAYDAAFSTSGVVAIAGTEVAKITSQIFGLETKAGFIEYMDDDSIPVFNCSMAGPEKFVLEIKPGEENKVVYGNYCATIYSKTPKETVMMADLVAYHLLKIMPDS